MQSSQPNHDVNIQLNLIGYMAWQLPWLADPTPKDTGILFYFKCRGFFLKVINRLLTAVRKWESLSRKLWGLGKLPFHAQTVNLWTLNTALSVYDEAAFWHLRQKMWFWMKLKWCYLGENMLYTGGTGACSDCQRNPVHIVRMSHTRTILQIG